MRTLILGLLLLMAALPAQAATGDFPYGDKLVFDAYRNGERIGQHTLTFHHDGPTLTVTTAVDIAAKMIGITVYRYTLRSQEVWNGDTFQSLTAHTDDDGKKFYVHAVHAGDSVVVDRDTAGKTRQTLPGTIIPASHWNILQTKQTVLLNAQKGTEAKVRITPAGHETVKTAHGQVGADRYHYEGDIVMDQWFDAKGRWVKIIFKAPDGSSVEYVLQD